MDFDFRDDILLAILITVIAYIVAYTLPTATSVLSNSTGLWKWSGTSTTNPNPTMSGIFPMASIIVPLVVMIAIILYFVKDHM